jgi:hypothetical protein
MKKVFGIKETDFFQFIKKINEFNETHDSFSTQTHIDFDNNIFYAVIYFDSQLGFKESNTGGSSPPLDEKNSKGFKREQVHTPTSSPAITPKQLKQLEKNKEYLESKDIDISTIKTSKQAWELLNKLYNGEV